MIDISDWIIFIYWQNIVLYGCRFQNRKTTLFISCQNHFPSDKVIGKAINTSLFTHRVIKILSNHGEWVNLVNEISKAALLVTYFTQLSNFNRCIAQKVFFTPSSPRSTIRHLAAKVVSNSHHSCRRLLLKDDIGGGGLNQMLRIMEGLR